MMIRLPWLPPLWCCLTAYLLATVTGQLVRPASDLGPSSSTFANDVSWPGYSLATFVDLNADRQMDIVLVSADARQLFAVIAPDTKHMWNFETATEAERRLPNPSLLLAPNLPDPIRSVAAADFNGDSVADLLISTGKKQYGPVTSYIAFGKTGGDNERGFFNAPVMLDEFSTQPLVCDLNSDMIADVFGEKMTGHRIVHFGGTIMRNESSAYSGPSWSTLGYSAFGDVIDDSQSEIILLVEAGGGQKKLQLIPRVADNASVPLQLNNAKLIDLPQKLLSSNKLTLGLFLLTDFDADGNVDLLLPACTSDTCIDNSELFVYNFLKNEWTEVSVTWTPPGLPASSSSLVWSLSPINPTPKGLAVSALAGSAVGDFDLDGRPDLGVVLTYSTNRKPVGQMPAVLLNRGWSASKNQSGLQAFLLPGTSLPETNRQIIQLAFFDHHEKGSFDIFVTSMNDSNIPAVQLFLQQMTNDHYFMKVTVLNGLCPDRTRCSDSRLPYGLPVPGIAADLKTESFSGTKQFSVALLGVQSCCAALQVPSNIFGLGPFANYVDRLKVAIPPDAENPRTREILALFPKSEVFVNPYPPDKPSRWQTKLFLQPLYNMKVLYIAITLICVCLLLIVIITVLHCLELRDDRLEKQREAQRFHFDAM